MDRDLAVFVALLVVHVSGWVALLVVAVIALRWGRAPRRPLPGAGRVAQRRGAPSDADTAGCAGRGGASAGSGLRR